MGARTLFKDPAVVRTGHGWTGRSYARMGDIKIVHIPLILKCAVFTEVLPQKCLERGKLKIIEPLRLDNSLKGSDHDLKTRSFVLY